MTSIIQGFLLGLANGASCLAACAPVLFPYLISEAAPVRKNVFPLITFLCGRLAGYLIFAVLTWKIGEFLRMDPRSGRVFGFVYAALAGILILYGFRATTHTCAANGMKGRLYTLASRRPLAMPVLLGLLTGLSLCPPFIAALAGATSQTSLISSLLFFLSFFVATSLYFIPFPIAGLFGRSQAIRITARLAAGIAGCYYLYRGLIMIHGGLRS